LIGTPPCATPTYSVSTYQQRTPGCLGRANPAMPSVITFAH